MSYEIPEDVLQLWGSKVGSSPDYAKASDDEKKNISYDFFKTFVSPHISDNVKDEAIKQWHYATVAPENFYSDPDFTKLESGDKQKVFKNNLLARGIPKAEVEAGGEYVQYPAGSDDMSIGGVVNPSLVDQEYTKYHDNPEVKKRRLESYGKDIGNPIVAAAGLKAAVTGDRGLAEQVNAYANRTNELQQEFPEGKAFELGATVIPAAIGGAGVSAATKVAEGAGPVAMVGRSALNTLGSTVVGTALNPEQVTEGGDQLKKLQDAKVRTAELNAAGSLATYALPIYKGGKALVNSAIGLPNKIEEAAGKIARNLGISKERVLAGMAADAAAANPSEGTIAGLTGVKSNTSPFSAMAAQDVVLPRSNMAIQNDVKGEVLNKQAEKVIEGVKYPTDAAGNRVKSSPYFYADSDVLARQAPVGDASEIAKTLYDKSVLPTSKLTVAGDPATKAVLDNSPTITSIKALGKAGAPAAQTTAEYNAVVQQYGKDTADNLVKTGAIKMSAPAAVGKAPAQVTVETMQNWIKNLNSEIETASTVEKPALMGVKNHLDERLEAVYKANPGLQEAVAASNKAHQRDLILDMFEKAIPQLDSTAAMGKANRINKNLSIDNPTAFLAANDNPAATKARATLMADFPDLHSEYNKLIDIARQAQRNLSVSVKTGAVSGPTGSAISAVAKQASPFAPGAMGNALEGIKKIINKNYAKALEDFGNSSPQAHEAINKALVNSKGNADFRTLYQDVIRPSLNTTSILAADTASNKNDNSKVHRTPRKAASAPALPATAEPIVLNLDDNGNEIGQN